MATATGRVPITPGDPHHVGFDKALQLALDRMNAPEWSQGSHKDVEVTFQLDVDVRSPGHVGFYKVTVSE